MKLAPSLLPCFLILAPLASQAQESYWSYLLETGYFDDSAAWHSGTAPEAATDVIFGQVGYPQFGQVIIRDSEVVNSFSIRSGSFQFSFDSGSLNLGSGAFTLNTSGSTTFHSGGSLLGGSLTQTGGETLMQAQLTLTNAGLLPDDVISHTLTNAKFTVDGAGRLDLLSNTNGSISQFIIGNSSQSSTLTLRNGGSADFQKTDIVLAAAAGGEGTIQHGSGTLHVGNDSTLYLAGAGHGTYYLGVDGVLEIGGNSLQGAKEIGGTYDFQLGGGKIVVTGAGLITDVDSQIVTGRTVIDTNGLSSEWAGNITTATSDGSKMEFAKEGSGHLVFSGDERDFIAFATLGGTMDQTAGDTTVGDFLVGFGAGNTASYDLNGGSITVSSTLRIGDYGGTGVFNHYDGDVTMEANTSLNIGNLGGTLGETPVEGNGTYNLFGGQLTLNAGSHNIGRSRVGSSSNGTFNLVDGLLLVQNGGQIIVGNREAGHFVGTGTFVQSGGVADFTTGKLFVGSYGHGSYQLNGGELLIGAGSLQANYGSSVGGYEFYLGGGTIKINGAGVDTQVAMTLTDGKTSTIHTNGYDATFRSAISGAGDFHKKGSGKLTLYNLSAGKVTIDEDTLAATQSLVATEVEIAAEARLETNAPDVDLIRLNGGEIASISGAFQLAGDSRLEGTGTIDSASSIFGTIQAGSTTAAGVIVSTGKLSVQEGSRFEFGVFENSSTDGSYSRIDSAEGFGFDGVFTLHLDFGTDVDFEDVFWETSGHRWIFFDGSIGIDELPLDFVVTSNFSYGSYGNFTLFADEVLGVGVEWQAIPEPSTVALLVGAGSALLLARRRYRL